MKLRPRDIVTASVAGILFGFLIYKGFPKVVKFPLALAGLSALLAIFAAAHILTLRTLQKTKKRIKEIQRTLANLPHAHALIKKNQEQLDILTYSLLDHWDLFEKSCQTESSGSAAELLKRTLQDIQKHRAPRLIPPRLLSDYTMGGQIKVQQKYRDSVYPPEKPVFYE
ncbi:MAG: hypothetical protein HYZ87_01850, partial [Candidatus Omnitrophica bacterium]|nr:hypothetical protein [Candidatus Omnitrophota bacterium]